MPTQPYGDDTTQLPEGVPVPIPELPATLRVSTVQQLKALADSTRSLILDIIKDEPLTAKQLGERLSIPSSTVSHHLQVLEAAGLAQIVARRLVHGIVAKYYMRTARLFLFDFPPEVTPRVERSLNFLTEARTQLVDALVSEGDKTSCHTSFTHARLSPERAEDFEKRLSELIYQFAAEPPDLDGQVYGFCTAFFLAPPYLQSECSSATAPFSREEK